MSVMGTAMDSANLPSKGGCVQDSIVMVAFCRSIPNHELLPAFVRVACA